MKTAADRAKELLAKWEPEVEVLYGVYEEARINMYTDKIAYLIAAEFSSYEQRVAELEARLQTERDTRNIVLNGRNDTVVDLSAKLAVATKALTDIENHEIRVHDLEREKSKSFCIAFDALAAIEGQSAKGEKT